MINELILELFFKILKNFKFFKIVFLGAKKSKISGKSDLGQKKEKKMFLKIFTRYREILNIIKFTKIPCQFTLIKIFS